MRQKELEKWLCSTLNVSSVALNPLAGDASFRKYYRMPDEPGWLAVDAPPEHEKTQEFVDIARTYQSWGLNVPVIKAFDAHDGFMLVSDLGQISYLDALKADPTKADALYRDALNSLVKITSKKMDPLSLESFDAGWMMQELRFFTEWYLEKYLKLHLNDAQHQLLERTYEALVARACGQTQVCIHRDYHSRNLMVTPAHNPGILDFQDAMHGPLTYDCVSLLRDAYIAWPRAQVEAWAKHFYEQHKAAARDFQQPWSVFLDDFNWMGIQRNLKAIFIFARKFLRDHNDNYLGDIPRTLNYVLTVSKDYPELQAFHAFLSQEVHPKHEALL